MVSLGIVPYLNAVPLTAAFGPDVRRIEAVPSALGELLETQTVDAALLPVYEGLHGIGDGWVGCWGIASRGPVASVLLFLRRPLREVRSLLLDPASRTSAALARHIVEREALGKVRTLTASTPGPDPRGTLQDAVLVIGDPALEAASHWDGDMLDLGAVWQAEMQLPFVYARWTARKGLRADERTSIAALLDEAARAGVRRAAAHARAWAQTRGRDPDAAAHYVEQSVHYHIGTEEEAGLARYADVVCHVRATEAGHA